MDYQVPATIQYTGRANADVLYSERTLTLDLAPILLDRRCTLEDVRLAATTSHDLFALAVEHLSHPHDDHGAPDAIPFALKIFFDVPDLTQVTADLLRQRVAALDPVRSAHAWQDMQTKAITEILRKTIQGYDSGPAIAALLDVLSGLLKAPPSRTADQDAIAAALSRFFIDAPLSAHTRASLIRALTASKDAP